MNSIRACAAFLFLLIPTFSYAPPPKIAPDLLGLDPQTQVSVIVQFAPNSGNAQQGLITAAGGSIQSDLGLIGASLVTIPASALPGLANNPNVLYIAPDRTVSATLDYANAAINAPYALQNGWDGTGVGIAVIDSGMNAVSDLQSSKGKSVNRIVYNQSFVPNNTSTADGYGHGTHVAGIIAGSGAS